MRKLIYPIILMGLIAIPFYTFIEHGKIGISRYENVVIPENHVGVLIRISNGSVEPEPLLPGNYSINLYLYKVEIVYTGKQTWTFYIKIPLDVCRDCYYL